ncbi:hypothetical protein RHAB21_00722 [Pseudorhizobium halotolerans]|uniref:Tail assembly chaperone n=1 Tax=Pseudorhizobium halotolerans TaxID=1233081 RepID=A0ABN7JZL5_9HYPH|nr:phage tail assembly chaperone [Pseudorhizobium halotolerans]CAD7055461.1 hypothetical protein RHAB21_00722 [Pseudorhizobium halotolerans]
MGFKLKKELIFPWPVKVIEPDPDNAGKHLEREFTALFAIIDPKDAKAAEEKRRKIVAQITPELSLDELKVIQAEVDAHDLAAIKQVMKGWQDIVDDDDRPIDFTDKSFREVLEYPRVKSALIRAYREAISEDQARLKN